MNENNFNYVSDNSRDQGLDPSLTNSDNIAEFNSKEKICSVEGCQKPNRAKGMCSTHYNRFIKTGSTDKPRRHSWRKDRSIRTVLEISSGKSCAEVYKEVCGSFSNGSTIVSRSSQESPKFDTALQCAKFSGKLVHLANETNDPRVIQLQKDAERLAELLTTEYSLSDD